MAIETPASAPGSVAPARIARALRASPFEWGDESHEAHFFSLVARLPLISEFLARVAPLVKPGSRASSVVAYRVRVQVRGSVLVVRDLAPASPILGAVSLSQAALRFVKKGTIAVIPPVAPVAPAAAAADLPPSDDVPPPVNPGRPPRRWWPGRRRRRDGASQPPSASEGALGRPPRAPPRPGFVLELDDHRRFPTVVDALSAAITIPRAPALTRFEMVRTLRASGPTPMHLVRDTQSGELLSMKLVRRCDVAASDTMRRVVDERAALERVRGHPFIIDLRHAFMTDTLIVFLFEHCRGGDLHHQLRLRKKGLREREATAVMAQIILAVENVHRVGSAVYRDLKPENVLLDAQGWVRLADFGLCRILDASIESGGTPAGSLRAKMRKRETDRVPGKLETSAERAARHSSLVGAPKSPGMQNGPIAPRATSEMNAHTNLQKLAPVVPLEDRPEKLQRYERGRRPRPVVVVARGDDTEEAAIFANAAKETSVGRTTSALTDQNSALEEQPGSRATHKPESSSTVTDWGSGGSNFPDAPSPRADTLMDGNGYRSPEMVQTGARASTATGYGRSTDMWSLGVLAHYVMTGAFPFDNCDEDDAGVPKPPPPPSSSTKVVLSPDLPSAEARAFVEGLLAADPRERLGCGFEGFDEVRMHAWLRSIDWDDLGRRDGAYQLKMLGDTHRAPTDEDEPGDAARAVAAFSGATGILGLGSRHELLPADDARPPRASAARPPPARRSSLSARAQPSRRASFSIPTGGRVRAALAKRRGGGASAELSLAANVPGGDRPASDGDVFAFAFSSSEQGFRPRRNSVAAAVHHLPPVAPRLSFGVSQRLSLHEGRLRRISRLGRGPPGSASPSGRVPVGGRKSTENHPARSADISRAARSMEVTNGRRASIERAKSGDFLTIDVGEDVEIPFRKSLEMVVSRRDSSV